MSDNKYKMTLSLNVLNHLGINLYSNIQSVLSEIVANAWDAEAENVRITCDWDSKTITVLDDGSGMDIDDINEKYLNVGYDRRKASGGTTPIKERKVMGRKGIGKLSLFSIANNVELHSAKAGQEAEAFRMTVDDIRAKVGSGGDGTYHPTPITPDTSVTKGTKIILTNLKQSIFRDATVAALRKKISRRFSIIGDAEGFNVFIGENKVTIEDRQYFNKLQYVWLYGGYQIEANSARNIEQKTVRDGIIGETGYTIKGWIGTAENSSQLKDEGENLNKISIIIRGKVAQEDILSHFNIGSIYSKYIIGEIQADFLDDDDQDDIATSSRQQIREDDPRYRALRDYILSELKSEIKNDWEGLRAKEGTQKALAFPPIQQWFSKLPHNSQGKAKALFGKINQIAENEVDLKTLLKQGVLAFEALHHKEELEKLDSLTPENIQQNLAIFNNFSDYEASLYHQITRTRISVIENLQEKVDANVKERIIQQHLFDHLWLLDPSWERAKGTEFMEQRVATEFDNIKAGLDPDEESGRIDIKYRTMAGKHIIIELKRASVVTDIYSLMSQMGKYRNGLDKILRTIHGADFYAPIECISVVGKPLKGWDDPRAMQEDKITADSKNMRIVQYDYLLENAYRAYKEYLDAKGNANRITQLLDQIDGIK